MGAGGSALIIHTLELSCWRTLDENDYIWTSAFTQSECYNLIPSDWFTLLLYSNAIANK